MNHVAQIVQKAYRLGFAIPAFNVPYLPMVEPVIRAVVDADSFAMIESARLEWVKFEAKGPASVAEEFHKWVNPAHISLHLDHIPVIDEDGDHIDYYPVFQEAILCGFESVMIDASRLDLQGNIKATKKVSELSHQSGIPCEAELGAVLGHEAGPLPPYEEMFSSGKGFTRVNEAVHFVNESGCDWLSVAIGNIHGAISAGVKDKKKVAAKLNLDHLKKLRDALDIPLVLHGGSGIPKEYVLESFKCGIAKINIATEIRQAYEVALKETGQVESAKEATYQKTRWLLEDYFGLAGIAQQLTGEGQ